MYKTKYIRNTLIIMIIVLLSFFQIYAERYIVNVGPGDQLMAGYFGYIGSDNINHWSYLNVTFYVNNNGAGDGLSFSQTKNAVQNGFDAWEYVSTSSIGFTYGGSTTSEWSIDNVNVHFWAETGDPIFEPPYNLPSYALGVTVITFNSNEEMTDVDIVFNGRDWTWRVDGTDYDIQAVSTHEIGHMIGLHHTNVYGSPLPTMYAYYFGTDMRTLEFDDETGVSFLYIGNLIDNETFSGTDYYDWDLNLLSNKTLTIQSRSSLKFESGTRLTINGMLMAEGTSSNPITFQSKTSTPADWYGIVFEEGSSGYLQSSEIIDSERMTVVKSGAYVEFSDDDGITLKPGFTVDLGGEFYAYIDPALGGGAAKLASSTGNITQETNDNTENTGEDSSQTDNTPLPTKYSLSHNYPNPFNLTTIIKYALKEDMRVSLKIYNVLGEEVRTLVIGNQTAGYKTVIWDGKNNIGNFVPSGIYIYRISTGNFIKSHKMILMK